MGTAGVMKTALTVLALMDSRTSVNRSGDRRVVVTRDLRDLVTLAPAAAKARIAALSYD